MQSPLLGFNNNVRHKGRIFHIQTEDSGIRHPHVITHLFMDGGRILKTVKTSYSQHLGNERLADLVRELMREQHKMMFIALRDGQFDYVLEGEDAPPPASMGGAVSLLPGQFEPTQSPAGASLANSTKPPLQPLAKTSVPAISPLRQAASAVAIPPSVEPASPPAARPGQRREAPDIFAATKSEASVAEVVSTTHDSAPPKKVEPRPGSGRYAASRPAAVFAGARTPETGGSIFGDDLISEKSLDEVILSYLSDDLETTSPRKK